MSAGWWKKAVFYEIYVRSFADSNGDGIGDLDGITAHLDYLNDGTPESLGVDALWLSPINPSPLCDFGYDVSDYCGIHPELGDFASFDRLLAEAHRRNIRVVLDLVPNHTSDQHPWFLESRSSRRNHRRDWYIWADGEFGHPPNNWLSTFGGSAWQYDEPTRAFYLHSFLPEQPDLNYRNPEVVAAMHDVLRFWLLRGVDGFRVDVISYLMKDAALRDNPPRDPANPGAGLVPAFSQDLPEVHEVVRGLRRVLDDFVDRMMVGEVWPRDQRSLADYLRPNECHLAFNFRFLMCRYDAASFRAAIEETETLLDDGAWPTYTLSNHDFARHISRYAEGAATEARARMLAVLMTTVRGTPFLYYGEEIGMHNVEIPSGRRRDPAGRDSCRTPMQWSEARSGGFTNAAATPWLPLGDCAAANVERERHDPHSMLSLYRRLIRLRRDNPALLEGTLRVGADAPADCLVLIRESASHRMAVALNFAGERRRITAIGPGVIALSSDPDRNIGAIGETLELSANEGVVLKLV